MNRFGTYVPFYVVYATSFGSFSLDVQGGFLYTFSPKKKIIIKDKNSKIGTYVNDKKINEAALNDGDVIRVGEAQFLFRKK